MIEASCKRAMSMVSILELAVGLRVCKIKVFRRENWLDVFLMPLYGATTPSTRP